MNIGILLGDDIGPEVVPECVKVMKAAAERESLAIKWVDLPIGAPGTRLARQHAAAVTEALRSFVLRVAWEHDNKVHSCNAGLAMNFSTDAVQEVTELYMEVRGAQSCHMDGPHRQAGARQLHLESSRRR